MTDKPEGILLLHGITCNGMNMLYVAKHLREAGYICHHPTYPSTFRRIEALATEWLPPVIDRFLEKEGLEQISIVAHSMGGLVTRCYLKHYGSEKVKRVVLIGTPNKGSQIADKLGDLWLFRLIFGPAGQQLRTTGIGHTLGALPVPTGIIAGTKSNWHLGRMLPKPNDGKVWVESAREEGCDFVTVERSHIGLLYDRSVCRHVEQFLKEEHF